MMNKYSIVALFIAYLVTCIAIYSAVTFNSSWWWVFVFLSFGTAVVIIVGRIRTKTLSTWQLMTRVFGVLLGTAMILFSLMGLGQSAEWRSAINPSFILLYIYFVVLSLPIRIVKKNSVFKACYLLLAAFTIYRICDIIWHIKFGHHSGVSKLNLDNSQFLIVSVVAFLVVGIIISNAALVLRGDKPQKSGRNKPMSLTGSPPLTR